MSINNEAELDLAIEQLELKKKRQEEELIQHFHATVDSFKPGNMIKSAVGKIGNPAVIGTILKTAGSLGVGFLTTKLAGGAAATSTGRSVIGSLLKQSAAKTVFGNFDKIKAYGLSAYKNIFGKH
ncbi:MAG: hypothetical protein EOO06_18530 [Chitinophagaceae bacterium]|nr:MAG: hypothetical protein EOO06_18530 [Chitinophagaceae bacterium]